MSGRRRTLAAAALVLVVSACSAAPEPPTPTPTPSTQSPSPSLSEQVEEVFTSASGVFQGYGDVRAFLVVADGETLVERYDANPPESTHNVYSVTKSVMSLLVGIALEEGHLASVDQTLGELLPQHAPVMAPEVAAVTLDQVLTMTAGIRIDELVITEASDPVANALTDSYWPAGEKFRYSDYGAHLLSAILAQATGVSTLDYAREHLFGPLGVSTAPAAEPLATQENLAALEAATFAWPVDPQGRHMGHAHLTITAQDMVAIGQLMLDGGRHEGDQIVPAEWVTEATRPHVDIDDESIKGYGYLWWVTTADGHDAFAAVGYGGQLIEVVPDLNLVVVAATSVPEAASMDARAIIEMVDEVIAPALAP